MAATKNVKPAVQLVAIDNIEIVENLQSRAEPHLYKEYVREFSEAILRGDIFPAVDVFWDGKKWWLADGFHRAEAHRKAGIIDIRCNIHYGTRRDAMIFSAGTTRSFPSPGQPRTKRGRRRCFSPMTNGLSSQRQ